MASTSDTPPSPEPSTIELKRAEEIKQDQGFHECEVSTSTERIKAEADLHKHLSNCQKNPGHHDFIPVNKFNMEKLPSGFKDPDIFNFIKAMINLTVCVCCTYTSLDRPETFPNKEEPYPFYNHRGKDMTRMGTGIVRYVWNYTHDSKKENGEEDRTCGCEECKNSNTPMTEWCEVEIMTAQHVVYDNSEAKETTCFLFYDSDEEKDKIQELSVKGGAASHDENIYYDMCEMACYIHDVEFGKQLEKIWEEFDHLYGKVCDKFRNFTMERPLTVIVSHPHGCSKQVTVGEMTHREEVDEYGYNSDLPKELMDEFRPLIRYSYTTQTCPGSSGAPVYIVGKSLLEYHLHPHSQRSDKDGLNMSGVWYGI